MKKIVYITGILFLISACALFCSCNSHVNDDNNITDKTTNVDARNTVFSTLDLSLMFKTDIQKIDSKYTVAIVEGTVQNTKAVAYERDVYTLSEIKVEKVLKGDAKIGEIITVSEPGGTITSEEAYNLWYKSKGEKEAEKGEFVDCITDNYKVMEKGQKVALFLDKTSDPEYEKEFSNGTAFFTVLGAYQGKYIYTDGKYINCTPDDIGNVERTIYTEESFEEMVLKHL